MSSEGIVVAINAACEVAAMIRDGCIRNGFSEEIAITAALSYLNNVLSNKEDH